MAATVNAQAVQWWLDQMLVSSDRAAALATHVAAQQVPGVWAAEVVCERCTPHPYVLRFSTVIRHLRETERVEQPAAMLGAAWHGHSPGSLRPRTTEDEAAQAEWIVDTCSSCDAPIIWAITKAGKRMPVNADPTPAGNVELVRRASGVIPVANVLSPLETAHAPGRLRLPHFATCPDVERRRTQHRNRAYRRAAGGRRG